MNFPALSEFAPKPTAPQTHLWFEPDGVLKLAALTLRFEAGFLVLNHSHGAVVLGQNQQRLVAELPDWVLPSQPHLLHQSAQLGALSVFLGQPRLENALGICLEHDGESLGALWLTNSLETLQPHSLVVLKALAQHIADLLGHNPIQTNPQPANASLHDSMLQALPVGVIAADHLGQIQQINQRYSQQFGYFLEDMKGKSIAAFVPPEDQDTVQLALENRTQGQSSLYRHKLFRKDGSLADVEVSGHPRFDANGNLLGSVAVVRDISEELALEQAALGARRAINKKMTDTLLQTRRSLEYEKNSAHEILEILQDGFALVGLDGKFEYVNPAFAQICDMHPQAMIGLEAQAFVHPEDLPKTNQVLQTLKPKSVVKYQYRVRQGTGKIVVVQARANLRHNAHHEVGGLLLTARDISSELASLAKVEQLEQELTRIGNNFQAGTGFLGRLETIGGAIGMMQMFSATPINGAIQLDDSMLFFRQGKIISIVHPKLNGEEAVRAVMQRQRGQFQFIPEVRPEHPNLNLDPTKIALELLTKHDEAHAPRPTASVQHVVLPNSKAAHAFMQGIGGRGQFQVTLENDQVVLAGRGFQIVVLDGKPEDF
jgi:PAS domain S-box-containing protein